MKIYDISQELLSSEIYPGDPSPRRDMLCDMKSGDACNVSVLSLCAHNGTHIDAPCHFIAGAASVDMLDPAIFCGEARVTGASGVLSAQDIRNIAAGARRLLIRGDITLSEEAARELCSLGIMLCGVESQSIGPYGAPAAIHRILLAGNVIPLEGIRLAHVPDGVYTLSAMPINIAGSDGSPVRAVLIGE